MNADVEQRAAHWLARRFAGLAPAEEREFQCWLAADPEHAAVYAELETTWQELDRVRLPEGRIGAPDPDALAPHRTPVGRRRWLPVAAAVAAAVVVGWSLGWGPGLPQRVAPADARHSEIVTTAVGEVHRFGLPDGSVVRVNTDSRIEVAYSATERRVRLVRGEAHFAVAKNPVRPFFVEAGGVAVRAVGTAFNVRLRADAIDVIVTEGRVRVADSARGESLIVALAPAAAAEKVHLSAGERVIIPVAATLAERVAPVPAVTVPVAEIERALAWRDRHIDAVAEPLAELVAEFNRYNRIKLAIEGPELAARRFGGSFRADDPETFVRLLETKFGLRVERRGDTVVLRP